jgi:hypothetical protein
MKDETGEKCDSHEIRINKYKTAVGKPNNRAL